MSACEWNSGEVQKDLKLKLFLKFARH